MKRETADHYANDARGRATGASNQGLKLRLGAFSLGIVPFQRTVAR
jgi:hypothetical protein